MQCKHSGSWDSVGLRGAGAVLALNSWSVVWGLHKREMFISQEREEPGKGRMKAARSMHGVGFLAAGYPALLSSSLSALKTVIILVS